jgi:hypothetical protein
MRRFDRPSEVTELPAFLLYPAADLDALQMKKS